MSTSFALYRQKVDKPEEDSGYTSPSVKVDLDAVSSGASKEGRPLRIPVFPWKDYSFGLSIRFRFPELNDVVLPGVPSSSHLPEGIDRARIVRAALFGEAPPAWELIDTGKLAKSLWKLFSDNIAPDFAEEVNRRFLSKTQQPLKTLDLILFTDIKGNVGAGLSLRVKL